MAMGIAISVGLREQSILASIFMLHVATMFFGLLTEYVSTPKYDDDLNEYRNPIGPDQWNEYKAFLNPTSIPEGLDVTGRNTFKPNYDTDRNALKIIHPTEWSGDRPADHVRADVGKGLTGGNDYFVFAQRRRNFVRRMLPHALGYFPMAAAWVIIIVHLEWARADLERITDRTIPDWVSGVVYGTAIVFWSFSIVQIIYQCAFRPIKPNATSCTFDAACTVRRPSSKFLLGQRACVLHAELDIKALSWSFLAHQRDLSGR